MAMNKGETAQMAIERLEAENTVLREDLNTRLSMTVARLGGIVDGNPTGKHNFLQRIDELRKKEIQVRDLQNALAEMIALASGVSGITASIEIAIHKATALLEDRKPGIGVFCLDHKKVMVNGICPKCNPT